MRLSSQQLDWLINAEPRVARFPDAEFTGVALADFLFDLAKKVQPNDATLTQV